MFSTSKFLQVAIDAAKKAERVILKYYQGDVRISFKNDGSPVTIADREAEKVIRETLYKAFPNHGFLGEETGSSGSQTEYTWIVDQIDGTKNYLRKIPIFATQIALMKNEELILGVSNAPALNEFMYAEKDSGAYLNHTQVRVSKIKKLKDAYLSFGGVRRFDEQKQLRNLLKLVVMTQQGHRGFGDFWGYHLLAQGKVDIVVEARINIWDIAAMKVIIEEAGGAVTDMAGKNITKDTTSTIATNSKLQKEVVDIFKNSRQ